MCTQKYAQYPIARLCEFLGGVRINLVDSNNEVVIQGPWGQLVYDYAFDMERGVYVVSFQLEEHSFGTKAIVIVEARTLRVLPVDDEIAPLHERAGVDDIGEPCAHPRHQNNVCLHVFARHPRIQPCLGKSQVTQNGISRNSTNCPGFQVMHSECVAEAVSYFRFAEASSEAKYDRRCARVFLV